MTSANSLYEPDKLGRSPSRERCGICWRQPAVTAVSCSSLDDFDDVEDTQISQRQWLLCAMCAQAVWREVERAALSTPLRVAVAAALVASVRNPQARPTVWSARYWEDMDCATQDKLAARAVIALILWPIMMLVGVVALTAALR